MKKNVFMKIASVLLCFMCLIFAGCGIGGPGDLIGDGYKSSLDGAKVLKRPMGYSFSDAVGKYSENYYNLFAREILYSLYSVYENNNTIYDEYLSSDIYVDLDTENGQTFGTFTGENKYYLYDSIRYTITNISTTRAGGGSVTGQVLTLDTDAGWNWNIKYNALGDKIVFESVSGVTVSAPDANNKLAVNLEGAYSGGTVSGSWESVYDINDVTPSFGEFYAGTRVEKVGDASVTNYFTSPYYQIQVEEAEEVTVKNYYQDALEYVIYLFVLGYDYQDQNGNATADAGLFNFEIIYDINGGVEEIIVGEGTQKKVIENALKDIKTEYQEIGTFVGITDKNKEQIANFIFDKVIGEKAYAKNQFSVMINDSMGNSSISFNRNYDKVVENIIDYACTQAPIGFDESSGQQVNLDNAFLVSTITDYAGDYFYVVDDFEYDIFRYIEPAEYQNIVLFPNQEDIGNRLTDIHLAFEYFDYNLESMAGLEYDRENGLEINVGVRYFDSSAGEYTLDEYTNIVVKYGKDSVLSEVDPEMNSVIFSEDDYGDDGVLFKNKVTIDTQFNNAIGNYAIDPFAGQERTEEVKSITIKGDSKAKNYYKLNNSAKKGFFGTLNEQMFMGADGCDFIEIYFDVVKDEKIEAKNYNFKVGLRTYYTMDEE